MVIREICGFWFLLRRKIAPYSARRTTAGSVRVARRAGTALDTHPIAPQHAEMAVEIAPAVRMLTGW